MPVRARPRVRLSLTTLRCRLSCCGVPPLRPVLQSGQTLPFLHSSVFAAISPFFLSSSLAVFFLFSFPPRQSFCSLGFPVFFGVFPTCVPCGGRMAFLGSLVVRCCCPLFVFPSFSCPLSFFCFLFLFFVFFIVCLFFLSFAFFLAALRSPLPPVLRSCPLRPSVCDLRRGRQPKLSPAPLLPFSLSARLN
jgi:hypothetical protein